MRTTSYFRRVVARSSKPDSGSRSTPLPLRTRPAIRAEFAPARRRTPTMSLRRPLVLLAAGVLAAAVTTTAAAQAQPAPITPQAPLTAAAMATNAAQSLVASRPAALHASTDDVFVPQSV